MANAVAFALRAEYEGTTTVELPDGSTEDRPTFGGGVLHTDPGDFDVVEQLAAGSGTIVVAERDQRLVDLLDTYPPLKRVPVPAGAKAISPYDRVPLDQLRHLGSLRDVDGAASLSRAKLIRALDRQDRQLEAGVSGEPAAADDESDADAGDAGETTTDTTAGS